MRSAWRIHPDLKSLDPVLESTYGIFIFQEQILAALKTVCDWSYAEADLVFAALRKKDTKKLAKAKPAYMAAGLARDYSEEGLEALWAVIEPFSDYSFNRAHSVAYAYTAYWCAWLKTHYPAEFIAALMTHEDDQAKIKGLILEARRLGIDVLPPDINDSGLGFTPTRDGIRYGLAAIKGLGEASLRDVLSERPFAGLTDFLSKAPQNLLNTRVFGALVSSGSLDRQLQDVKRNEALRCAEELTNLASSHRKRNEFGEYTLLPPRYIIKTNEDVVDYAAIAEGEKETIGIQLTHPTIVLKIPGTLTTSEASWLNTVLSSRDPVSQVIMDSGGFRVKLPVKSSERGLANAVAKLGIVVNIE